MYKKGWIICLLLAVAGVARAQVVSMTLEVPPTGVLAKPQLWNLLLVNPSVYTQVVQINLVLTDEKTNQPVLTASSMPITLSKGVKQITAKNLGAIQYTYVDPSYRTDNNPNGLLPVGNFQACYTIVNAEREIATTTRCIEVNVDPLSPPLLNTPADSGYVYTPYPQFTWLPPTPPGMFSDLSYAMVLVSILPGQSPGDAIQFNVPVYSGAMIRNMYLNYPSSYPSLDTSKTYAWRIVALNAGQAVGMSDIWTFRYTKASPVAWQPQRPVPYIALQRTQGAAVATSGSTLKLTYDNAAGDTTVQYSVRSLNDPGNPVVQQGKVSLKYGTNFIQISLSGNYGRGKVYLFELVNRRNESWNLKFTSTP
jgi:hypothetical protein